MYKFTKFILVITLFSVAYGNIFNFENFQNYSRIFGLTPNESNNELWQGILKDCSKKVTFSCIQKNAYSYLEQTFIDRDNITVFDGFSLTRNHLDYDTCFKDDSNFNKVENTNGSQKSRILENNVNDNKIEEDGEDNITDKEEKEENEYLSPLEEVTHALRSRTIRFLATRDYRIQLPSIFGQGISLQISPRKIYDTGALIRIDFNSQEIHKKYQGRLFLKKISKFQ
jgi:hypothetical protein